MRLNLSKANLVVFGLIVGAYGLASLEQCRIHRQRKQVYSASLVRVEGTQRQQTPQHLPITARFDSAEDRLIIAGHAGKRHSRRVRITLRYRLAGSGRATLNLLRPGDPKHPVKTWSLPHHQGRPGRFVAVAPVGPGPYLFAIGGSPGMSVTLSEASLTVLMSRFTGPPFGGRGLWLLLLIIAALPLYWLLHRRQVVAEWFLVGLSGTLLLLIDVLFALALAAILLGLYAARRSLIARQSRRLLLFVILVVSCMAFLFLFKYAPHWYYGIFLHIGAGDVGLPLGLSYFFFRLVHVVMGWYRGLLADLSLRQFLCFAIFFPTVPAGPIETVDSFNDKRLDGLTLSVVSEAVWRILLGLFKKTFVVGLLLGSLLFRPGDGLMDSVLADPGAAPQTKVWLSLVLCLLYAYLDLSAYTDIAIGTGLLFGYRIRENFKRPLLSRNIAEFWQRYHISLGEWCRRHVYFPVLMISRNTSLAILLTMMTMGMWHHVNLNWGLWAVHHGVGIMWIMLLGRWGPKSKPAFMKSRVVQWVWTPVAIGLTVLWVAGCIALVFIEDIETALRLYVRFFTLM